MRQSRSAIIEKFKDVVRQILVLGALLSFCCASTTERGASESQTRLEEDHVDVLFNGDTQGTGVVQNISGYGGRLIISAMGGAYIIGNSGGVIEELYQGIAFTSSRVNEKTLILAVENGGLLEFRIDGTEGYKKEKSLTKHEVEVVYVGRVSSEKFVSIDSKGDWIVWEQKERTCTAIERIEKNSFGVIEDAEVLENQLLFVERGDDGYNLANYDFKKGNKRVEINGISPTDILSISVGRKRERLLLYSADGKMRWWDIIERKKKKETSLWESETVEPYSSGYLQRLAKVALICNGEGIVVAKNNGKIEIRNMEMRIERMITLDAKGVANKIYAEDIEKLIAIAIGNKVYGIKTDKICINLRKDATR